MEMAMMKRLSVWILALAVCWGCDSEETEPTQDIADAAVDMVTPPAPMADMGIEDMEVGQTDMAPPASDTCGDESVLDFSELGVEQEDGD